MDENNVFGFKSVAKPLANKFLDKIDEEESHGLFGEIYIPEDVPDIFVNLNLSILLTIYSKSLKD